MTGMVVDEWGSMMMQVEDGLQQTGARIQRVQRISHKQKRITKQRMYFLCLLQTLNRFTNPKGEALRLIDAE
jgi:hypothetical protein